MSTSRMFKLSNKQLSLLVAGAIGFGMAFGVAPSQVSAMTVTQSGNSYTVDGTTMNYSRMLAAVKTEAAKDNATITIDGSGAATAFSGEDVTLGKGTTLTVTGATNSAKIVGGNTANTVKIDGTAVTGTDVNLASVSMSAKDKTAKLGLSGSIGSLEVAGGTVLSNGTGTLTVDNLKVADGTDLTVSSGTVSAKTTTVEGTGTKLTTSEGSTLKTDTLTLGSGATLAENTQVTTNRVVVADVAAAAQLANLTVTSATAGQAVTIDTSSLSAADQKTVAEEVSKVKTTEGTTTKTATVSSSVTATGNGDGTYTLKNASGETLTSVKTIADAYANGANSVTIDKETAKTLARDVVSVPAGKTLTVSDGDNTVSATAKNDVKVNVDGTTVKAAAGAATPSFSEIMVNTPTATVVNELKDVTADKVTVKAGTVKTENVTAKELTLGTGANVVGANSAIPAVKADTITVADASQLAGLSLEPATEGGTIEVKKESGTFSKADLDTIVNAAGKDVKLNVTDSKGTQEVTGNSTTTIAKGANGYTVNGKAVSGSLDDAIKAAFEASDQVVIDASAAKDLSTKTVTVPGGKTLTVVDGENTVSATPKKDAAVKIDGYMIGAADGTEFSNLVVKAPDGKVITNNIKNLKADSISVTNGTVKTGDFTVKELTINGGSIQGINGATPKISAGTVTVSDVSDLDGVVLTGIDGKDVTVKKADGKEFTADEIAKIQKQVDPSSKVSVNGEEYPGLNGVKVDPKVEAAKKAAKELEADKTTLTDKIAAMKEDKVNPFTTALTTTSDVEALNKEIEAFNKKNKALGVTVDELDEEELAKDIEAGTKVAGRSLAAPSLAGAHASLDIADLFADGIADRTADLRAGKPASAVADKLGDDAVWFAIKGGENKIDNSNYGKSKTHVATYQLGYDTQVGPNDYLGVFVGTASGSASTEATYGGSVDIKHAFNGGIYGTHLMPNNQYLDYTVQAGKFDNKFDSYGLDETWGTKNVGASLTYGVKLQQSEHVTMNPYLRFKYDKLSLDDVTFAGNTVKAADTDVYSAKLGVNWTNTYGFTGGIAYSRGLSGDYDATVNGVSMAKDDFDQNVIYLNLGYRGAVNDDTLYSVNFEKTCVDYDGWSGLLRLDFLF